MAQIIDQVLEKATEYCANEENRQKLLKPLEEYISVRFSWIIRCFEVIAFLALLQTVLLLYVIFFRTSAARQSVMAVSS